MHRCHFVLQRRYYGFTRPIYIWRCHCGQHHSIYQT